MPQLPLIGILKIWYNFLISLKYFCHQRPPEVQYNSRVQPQIQVNDASRVAEFTEEAPIDWRPHRVKDPRLERLFATFTKDSCWEFILEKHEDGHEIEEVKLEKPPGSKGYVMKIDMGTKEPQLYIKLQIGTDKAIGRSFHYSKHRKIKA